MSLDDIYIEVIRALPAVCLHSGVSAPLVGTMLVTQVVVPTLVVE
jgi:hypothetical protein